MAGEHIAAEIADFLFDELGPEEKRAFSAHVDECAACRRELLETQSVLQAQPEQLDPVAPPPSLKSRLLEAAGADLRPADDVMSAEAREGGKVVLGPWHWAGVGLAAGFLLAVLGGVLGWAIYLNSEVSERDEQLAESREAIEAIVSSGQILTMEGTAAAPDVHAALVVPREGEGVLVLANNVPAPEQGTGYHLWLFSEDTPTPGGVLVPDENGRIATRLDADISGFDRMELDLQPLGSEEPGGTTVIEGDLG
jgi:anti-sigma factor RsiW